MKKLTAALFIGAFMILSMAGTMSANYDHSPEPTQSEEPTSTPSESPEPTFETPSEEPSAVPTIEPTPEPTGSLVPPIETHGPSEEPTCGIPEGCIPTLPPTDTE